MAPSYPLRHVLAVLVVVIVASFHSPSTAMAELDRDTDLTWRDLGDGSVELTAYPGADGVVEVRFRLTSKRTGLSTTLTASPGIPTTIVVDEPEGAYSVLAEGLDVTGSAIELSPVEDMDLKATYLHDPSLTTPKALGLDIRSIDPQNCPFIFTTVEVGGLDAGTVLSDQDFSVYEDGRLQTQGFDVEIPTGSGGSRIADIVFLVDNSGSMGDEQASVRANIIAFAQSLEQRGIDFRLGLVRFGQSANSGNPILVNGSGLTSSAEVFRDQYLSQLTTSGGWEPGIEAILQACSGYAFRPGSQRHFLVITDEDSDGGSLASAISCAQANNVTVHTAVRCGYESSGSDYCYGGSIRDATGGLLFNVTQSYGPVLDQITQGIASRYVVRYETDNACSNGGERTVEVVVDYAGDRASDVVTYRPGSAPSIERTPETIALSAIQQVENQSVAIACWVRDRESPFVQSVTLHYRTTGAVAWTSTTMTASGSDLWQADVPAGSVQPPGVDYYITASDGLATVSDPPVDPRTQAHQFAVRPNEAPVITHTPLSSAAPGQDAVVEAVVVDNTDFVNEVVLSYRETGDLAFANVPMVNTSGDTWRAVVPGSEITSLGLEYRIRATDNLGVSQPDGPYQVSTTGANCRTYGQIEICADSIVDGPGGDTVTFSGNVTMNGILAFSGDLELTVTDLGIQGMGAIRVIDVPTPSGVVDVAIYDGSFAFSLLGQDGQLTNFLETQANSYFAAAGLTVEIDLIEIDLADQGVRIAGELGLPEALGSVTIDIDNLEVSATNGVEFAGCIEDIPDLSIGKLGVQDLSLCYDSNGNCFSGTGFVDAGVVTVGTDGTEVCNGQLQRVSILIETSPGVALGPTGFFLTGGSGTLDHIQDPPVLVRVTVDISGGPTAPTGQSLVGFDDLGMGIRYPQFVEATGGLSVFGIPVADGSMRYGQAGPRRALSVEGSIDFVQILIVESEARVETDRFYGRTEGTLQIPELQNDNWFLQRVLDVLNNLFDLPISLANTEQEIDNESIQGIARAGNVELAHRVSYSDGLEVFIGENFDELIRIYPLFRPALARVVGSPVGGFEVPHESDQVIFLVRGIDSAPSLTLEGPNGGLIDQTTAQGLDTVTWSEDPAQNNTVVIVNRPYEGLWTVWADEANVSEVVALRQRPRPSLEVDAEIVGDVLTIETAISVPDSAALSFHLDDDADGWDGAAIFETIVGESGRRQFTVSVPVEDFIGGDYYVYGRLQVGDDVAAYDYAPGTVRVVDPAAPSVPSGLRTETTDGRTSLLWDEVAGAEGYAVYARRPGNDEWTDILSLFDAPPVVLDDLVAGHTYEVAVKAMSPEQIWSPLSESLEVLVETAMGNHAPEIRSSLPEWIPLGETLEYAVVVVDLDGDPLEFTLQDPVPGMTLSSDGMLRWTPTEFRTSTTRPRIVVRDPDGAEDVQIVDTEVVANDFGRAFLEFDRSVYVGESATALVEVDDPDAGSSLELEVTSTRTSDVVTIELTRDNDEPFVATIPFEATDANEGALFVTEGSRIVARVFDATTSEWVESDALWVNQWPLGGEVDIDPDTLNEGSQGQWVTVYYEPPSPYTPEQVDTDRTLIAGDLTPDPDRISIADEDGDGRPELVMKVDRAAFVDRVDLGEQIEVPLKSVLYAEFVTLPVENGDVIRVIAPSITSPAPGDEIEVGSDSVVAWSVDDATGTTGFRVQFSQDDRLTWSDIATVDATTYSVPWQVPDAQTDQGWVKVLAYSGDQVAGSSVVGPFSLVQATDVAPDAGREFGIASAVPNPFNPRTELRFVIPEKGRVEMKIYDAQGRLVRALLDEVMEAGSHVRVWSGEDDGGRRVASGVYRVIMTSEGRTDARSVTLIK